MTLKILRTVAAVFFLSALTLFFIDFFGVIPLGWHRLAHIQLVPLLIDGAVIGIAAWAILTLLFGRIYCSTVCPLGILQDIFSRIARLVNRKKKYKYNPVTPRRRAMRYGFFVLMLLGFAVPVPILLTLLDPYSNFGRIVTTWLRPLVLLGNNLVTAISHAMGNYSPFYMPIIFNAPAIIVSLLVFVLVGWLSFRYGRWYCNSICPVGTLLGLLSRFSIFRVKLNEKCIGCLRCENVCKGECIDSKKKSVDMSRCVSCFNCLTTCRKDAISFGLTPLAIPKTEPKQESKPQPTQTDTVRRHVVLVSVAAVLGRGIYRMIPPAFFVSLGVKNASASTVPETLPSGTSRVSYELTHPIFPPGGREIKQFQRRCTGCHLCVSKCPAGILTPAGTEYGVNGFLQPVVKFQHGFCNYDCTICTQVCPNHALEPLDSAEKKHLVQIGKVHFLKENCVVNTQNSNCGACAEHCPTGAVKMVPYGPPENFLTIPEIDPELCVGCGACEYICPVRPYRAIYIDGQPIHEEAKLAYDPNAKQEVIEIDDFGF